VLFNSAVFIFAFLPITLLVYYAIWRRAERRWAYLWLAAASLFFYGWWDLRYVPLIVALIVVNYGLGVRVGDPTRDLRSRRRLLTFGICLNLAALGYFKYAGFLIQSAGALLDRSWSVAAITLPLGISFFTFQKIAFLVDAYRGKVRDLDFTRFALFVLFFPQLIAGPIVHPSHVLPQFAAARPNARLSAARLAIGGTIFAIGLFKKVVIADRVAAYSTPVFDAADAGAALTFLEAWCGALAYSFQLYFDFSGYSDMAIGLGQLFGIRLPQNFNSPYRTASIIDFWRAWHMTLSAILREYLYIALGGNRRGTLRRYLNLMATMLLGGLWHGASWNFVLWGGLHGLYLMANHAWRALRPARHTTPWRDRPLLRIAPWSLTFAAVVLAWVLFRAETFAGALRMLRAMLAVDGIALPAEYAARLGPLGGALARLGVDFRAERLACFWGLPELAVLAGLLGAVTLLPNTCELIARYRPALEFRLERDPWRLPLRWRLTPAWAVIVAAMAIASVSQLSRVSEFLYFQF
jgi:D-alanyl-lipoteichoic acid acyltransferase DltB (MBOAT superfamily)